MGNLKTFAKLITSSWAYPTQMISGIV